MSDVDNHRVPEISVVLPVYNEVENIDVLYERLKAALEGMGVTFELVFVDDGSSDGSTEKLHELHARDDRARVIQFSRNFGHHMAVTAGIDYARGDAVILMDSDLQDRPEEIPRLYEKLNEGYDVVFGIRVNKKHSWFKRTASACFFALMRTLVSDFEMNSGIFRIARRRVIDVVKDCREVSRFIVGLMSWVGFKQVGIEVQHGERHAGYSKYSLRKQVQLAVATLFSFSVAPLKLITRSGMLVAVLAAVGAIVIILRKLIWGFGVIGWPSMMVVILFLSGVQLIGMGIIGEYLGTVMIQVQGRPLYVVAEHLDTAPRDN